MISVARNPSKSEITGDSLKVLIGNKIDLNEK